MHDCYIRHPCTSWLKLRKKCVSEYVVVTCDLVTCICILPFSSFKDMIHSLRDPYSAQLFTLDYKNKTLNRAS